ncbi:MAG: hypothetical protein ABUL58_01180, partial [Steroidobacter sp.]
PRYAPNTGAPALKILLYQHNRNRVKRARRVQNRVFPQQSPDNLASWLNAVAQLPNICALLLQALFEV